MGNGMWLSSFGLARGKRIGMFLVDCRYEACRLLVFGPFYLAN